MPLHPVRTLLDVCFPPRCAACDGPAWESLAWGGSVRGGSVRGGGAASVCGACLAQLPRCSSRCRACGRRVGPHGADRGCPACAGPEAERDALRWSGKAASLSRRAVRGVVTAWSYAGPPRELVLALKFRARLDAAHWLATALADALELDLDKFFQLCSGAAAQSWIL